MMLQQHLEFNTLEKDRDDSHSSSHPLITTHFDNNDNNHTPYNISKYLYFVIAAIISTEFCERLCYYGIQGSLNLFLQNQLGQSKANASFNVAIFGGVCYLTPLIGGYIADTYLGRYYAIVLFITFYLIGIIGIAVISWILSEDHNDSPLRYEIYIFWIALYLVALGTGGIKPNVSTLGAEQFETDVPQFSLKQQRSHTELTSELMPISYDKRNDLEIDTNYSLNNNDTYVDDEINNSNEDVISSLIIDEKQSVQLLTKQKKQKESFFNWFYFSINLGSLVALSVVAYLCQNVNFGIGYTVPAVALIIAAIVFILCSKFYRIVPPQGSILSDALKIIYYGIKNRSLENAKIKYGNDRVESVKSVVKLLPFLGFNVMYWCVYANLSTLFYAQGCQMDITITKDIEIPIAALNLFDIIPILILVPFFDRILIPCLRKRGFRVTMLQRMGCGFVFAMLAMISAGILEIFRKKTAISDIASACNVKGETDSIIYVSDISIFYQMPQFIFVGTSEVLASITGLEFFFSQAPPEMRSILASLNLVTTGLGSWLVGAFIMLVNINKNNLWITDNLNNGHLDLYFFMIAIFCCIAFIAFLWSSIRYEYNNFEKDILIFDSNKPDMDAMFDDLMETTPRVDDLDINVRSRLSETFNYSTPPAHIKDIAMSTATHN
eukprot:527708_1